MNIYNYTVYLHVIRNIIYYKKVSQKIRIKLFYSKLYFSENQV